MDKWVCFVFIFNLFCAYANINITELKGPNSVEYGSTEDVVLDCDFEAIDEKDLEIKWYYNGDRQVIYQWVPDSRKSGYAMGLLKDHIDVNYIATNDSNTMYRALRIYNVTTDLTGNYTCKVSSFLSEDSETKQLIVYIPSKFGLELILLENDQTVICSSYGIFPKPEINLYVVERDNKTDVEQITLNNSIEYDQDEDGLYNVTAIYFFPNLTSFVGDTRFSCELSIPGTDYLLTSFVTYQTVDDVIEYDVDEEEYIWNINSTSSEEYFVEPEDSAANYFPGISLSAGLTVVLLILCK